MTTTITAFYPLNLPTISPFGIDGNTYIQLSSPLHSTIHAFNQSGSNLFPNISNSPPFSPFDINVKEETFFH
jgi:hypothetical protein